MRIIPSDYLPQLTAKDKKEWEYITTPLHKSSFRSLPETAPIRSTRK